MPNEIQEIKNFLDFLHKFIGNNNKILEKQFNQNYEINTGGNARIEVDTSALSETLGDQSQQTGNNKKYNLIKDFCLNAKLIIEKEKFLRMSELGKEILKEVKSKEKFNQKIIENCLTNNYFSSILSPLLKKFENKQNKLLVERDRVYDLFKKPEQLHFLLQILYGIEFLILDHSQNFVFVNTNYSNLSIITQSNDENKPQSQKELDDLISKQKKIGELAEEIVLNYEKMRLIKLGCPEKAERVKQVSIDDTRKGYDIESFNGIESDDISPDRFIEVKGTAGKKFSIIWSENEIEKAKDLGSEYWIYSVTEIDLGMNIEKYSKEPERIQDPYSKINPLEPNHPNDEYFKITEKKFHITKNK